MQKKTMGNQQSGDKIKTGKRLGGGSYGEVFKGTWNGRPVALKKFYNILFQSGSYNEGNAYEQCKQEWDILSQLDHPNIVKYHTVILSEKAPPILVLELCDYDLTYFINEVCQHKVPFQDTVSIMSDVAEGLDYLHNFKPAPIIHRDLGSKNIVLNVNRNQKQAKITDMGLSKAFPQRAMYASVAVGTPVYAAPETCPHPINVQKNYYIGEKIDIFSFGAVLLEVIIGRMPMHVLPHPRLKDGKVVPEYIRRNKDLCEMGTDHPLHSLVLRCLENVPENRPSARHLIEFLARFKPDDAQTDSASLSKSVRSPLASSPRFDGYSDKPSGSMPQCASVMELTKNRYDHSFKVAVLGDPGVGKTSIIQRFLHPQNVLDPRSANYKSTIQPGDFFERLTYMGRTVHLHIVDTPGNKMLVFHHAHNAAPIIYRGVNGVAVVFDVGNRFSFRNVIDWLKEIHERCGEDTPIVLVGNKTDLEQTSWKVSSTEAQAFALQHNLFYIETSAVGLINIDEIFCILIQRMIDRESDEMEPKSPDWIFYQSGNHSLLKFDGRATFTDSITARETAPPLPSENIQLLPETPSINQIRETDAKEEGTRWCQITRWFKSKC